MGGWLGGVTVQAGTSNTNKTENTYGTHTPTISNQYNTAYGNASGALDGSGANATQQNALNYMQGQLDPNANGANSILGQNAYLNNTLGGYYANIGGQAQGIFNQSAPQAQSYTADAYGMNPAQIAAPQSSGGYTGADYAGQYANLFGSQVTDPALAAYDYGTARNLSALDSRIAGSGGFANSRSEIPYGDMLAQAALGRGQLSSQLNQQGLNSALGFASQDANRLTQNNQFNTSAANQTAMQQALLNQQANQFNAQNQTQNSQFNANQQQNNSQFNVGAQNQNTQNRLAALGTDMASLQARSGLSNQAVQNIVTANGINMQAAQNLFNSGAITQDQLNSIANLASQYNGYSYTQDTNGSSNTTYANVKASTPGGGG